MKLDLVILCGGRGSRLGRITKNTPKSLIKIEKINFLDHIINFYKKYDFSNIYLLTGYKNSKFIKYKNLKRNLIDIKLIKEQKIMGTAGALFQLKKKIKNDFILVNGDSYLNYNFNRFLNKDLKNSYGKIILIKNKNYKDNKKLVHLKVDKSGTVTFSNKSKLMNAGIYYFKKKILKLIKNNYYSLEDDLLPKLINKEYIKGFVTKGYFVDIGTITNLKRCKKNFRKNINSKCAFLDRDGVINHDYGYVHTIKKLKYKKGVINGLRRLSLSHKIFIITNQAGIGRGMYTMSEFISLHKKIKTFFLKKNIYIDDIKFCPHHPVDGIGKYKKLCECRKPNNGMIKNILKENFVNKKKSFMIGDKKTDLLCAKKSNLKFYYTEKNFDNLIKKIT